MLVHLLQLTARLTKLPFMGKPVLITRLWQRRWARAEANCSLCLTAMSCQGELIHPNLSCLLLNH